jgi:hypothetical protein
MIEHISKVSRCVACRSALPSDERPEKFSYLAKTSPRKDDEILLTDKLTSAVSVKKQIMTFDNDDPHLPLTDDDDKL